MNDLLDFLASYGRNINDCPIVWPAFNNYYQDINNGGSRLGNLTLLNGERMFPPDDPDRNHPDFEFMWYVDGYFRSDKGNPTLLDLKPDSCAGVVEIELVIIHKPTRSISSRKQWGYMQWLDLPSCDHPGNPGQFGVFYSFYAGYDTEPRKYMKLEYDYDNDGFIGVKDLMDFLASRG
jgi:hypothetical protein